MPDYLEIGVIVNTHGVKGEVKVVPHTFDMRRFELLSEVTARRAGSETTLKLKHVKYHKQFVILALEGVDDMSGAARLKGYMLTIPKELALPLDEDEYYIGDLIGCRVTTITGEALGEIADVLVTGANDVYVVDGAAGGEVLIPAIKQCVIKVDINEKAVVVNLPEGLR